MNLSFFTGFTVTVLILGGLSGGAASAADRLPAVYEVPVQDDLKPFARFETQQFSVQKDAQNLEISYTLPATLTGFRSEAVRFKGPLAQGIGELHQLTGPNGTASCAESTSGMTCLLKMNHLQIDVAARDQFLSATSTDPSVVAKRTQVADLFFKEPIGVITYRNYSTFNPY